MASIKKLDGGPKYRVQYRNNDNRQRSKHFDRKADAEAFADAIETSKRVGTYTDPSRGRLTFAAWCDRWLALPTGLGQPPGTRESYLRSLIRPTFDRSSLRDVGRDDVQAWVHDLERTGLAPATIAKAVQILSKMLDAAIGGTHRASTRPVVSHSPGSQMQRRGS